MAQIWHRRIDVSAVRFADRACHVTPLRSIWLECLGPCRRATHTVASAAMSQKGPRSTHLENRLLFRRVQPMHCYQPCIELVICSVAFAMCFSTVLMLSW